MNNPPEKWRERLLAQGADPQSFLIMAKIIAQMMDVADKGIAPAGKQVLAGQAAIVNWGKAYQTSPHVMTQITRSFDPTMDLESPSEEFAIGPWLRDTMAKVKKITQKADRLTDKRTGLFTDDAMQTKELKAVMEIGQSQTGGFLVEIQVAIDHVVAAMTWGTTMRELLDAAETGEDTALFKALSLNPLLAYHAEFAGRIQQAIAKQEHGFLRQMHLALAHRPRLHKNAKAGFIMAVLWEAGLKRLTYNQVRGFLKAVGLLGVPSHQALERYGQRLGLKKYHIEQPSSTGHENE